MYEQFSTLMAELLNQTGLLDLWWGNIVMIIVGGILLYLKNTSHFYWLALG